MVLTPVCFDSSPGQCPSLGCARWLESGGRFLLLAPCDELFFVIDPAQATNDEGI
jgi:hypothetical protein